MKSLKNEAEIQQKNSDKAINDVEVACKKVIKDSLEKHENSIKEPLETALTELNSESKNKSNNIIVIENQEPKKIKKNKKN